MFQSISAANRTSVSVALRPFVIDA